MGFSFNLFVYASVVCCLFFISINVQTKRTIRWYVLAWLWFAFNTIPVSNDRVKKKVCVAALSVFGNSNRIQTHNLIIQTHTFAITNSRIHSIAHNLFTSTFDAAVEFFIFTTLIIRRITNFHHFAYIRFKNALLLATFKRCVSGSPSRVSLFH